MDVKTRVDKYIDLKGISVFSFEKSIGCSNGYWRKTKSISANILSKISNVYTDLSIDWVITGNGTIFKSDKKPTTKDRIRKFIEYHGLTEPKFCRSINLSSSYYDKIEEEIPEKNLKTIQERYPRLNIEWLITGEGSMYRKMQPINDKILIVTNKIFNEDPFKMCEAIGIDQSIMIPILANNDTPPSDIINLFIEKTGVSSDWLLYSKGSMFNPEFTGQNIDHTNRLKDVMATSESTISEPEEQTSEESNTVNYKLVPLFNLDAVGGMRSLNSESDDSEYIERLIPFTDAQDGDIALFISGNSMDPTCPAGSKVLIREVTQWNEYFGFGNIFVLLLTDGRRILKEVQKWQEDPKNFVLCRSHNDKYPEEELPKSMIAGVWKVIKILNERGW